MFENFQMERNGTTLVADQIERAIGSKIKAGALKPGTKLPSTKDLASEWNVNPLSIQKAMKTLKNMGLIHRRARNGTFVKGCDLKVNIAILCQNDLAADFAAYTRLVVASMRKVFLRKNSQSLILCCLGCWYFLIFRLPPEILAVFKKRIRSILKYAYSSFLAFDGLALPPNGTLESA